MACGDNLGASLEELLAPIKEKLKMHPNGQELSEQDLKDINKELTGVVVGVSETFRLYARELDRNYDKNKPFSNENVGQDIKDFMRIIQDSFITGSFEIIKKWAIEYPFNNPQILQKPIEYYVENLRKDLEQDWDSIVSQEGWHPEAKVYWQYLVDTLESIR